MRTKFQPGPATDHYHATIGVDEQTVPTKLFSATLTDEEFRAIADAPHVLMPAVEGKLFIFVRGILRLDRSAGAYSTSGRLFLAQFPSGFELSNLVGFTNLEAPGEYQHLTPATIESDEGWLPEEPAAVLNEAIAIWPEDGTTITGGHPDNTLKVDLLYMEIDL